LIVGRGWRSAEAEAHVELCASVGSVDYRQLVARLRDQGQSQTEPALATTLMYPRAVVGDEDPQLTSGHGRGELDRSGPVPVGMDDRVRDRLRGRETDLVDLFRGRTRGVG
jgi:hypothetical protein